MIPITGAVEGLLDDAVVRRLIEATGGSVVAVHGRSGRPFLEKNVRGYASAARFSPWFVLADLDTDSCAPDLVQAWMGDVAVPSFMCMRIAVREVESWLLADRVRIAKFLGVREIDIPIDPDDLHDPKATVVSIARGSTRVDIRRELLPEVGSGRQIGPAYTTRMAEFARDRWRPEVAVSESPSLKSAIRCLRQTVGEFTRWLDEHS
jgi:hypothetical protein